MKQYLTSQGLQTLWNQIKALFVAKEAGKGLSSNDYTTAEKNKLSGIASGAEVNTIVAVQRNGTAITPKDRVVNILVPVKTSELNNDSTYQTAADVAETIVGVKLDLASGIITLTRKNGTTFALDLPTEKIIKSGHYDSETKEIVLVLEDSSEIRFSASELIDEYYADENTIELYTDTADGNKKKFRLKTVYKNKIDGSEQTTNKTASVSASSTATQYPNAKAVYDAVKDLATKVQTFAQANTRANIESGETIATMFGKVAKWFSDLKSVAFSGSYNDLIDTPRIGNLAKLDPDSTESSFSDTQKIIASPSNGVWGGTSCSKTALMMWNYINSKISSVLGLTASAYKGVADNSLNLRGRHYFRNNAGLYQLIGEFPIDYAAYQDRACALLIQGLHNTNIGDTLLFNVSYCTSQSSYAAATIVCLLGSVSDSNKINILYGELIQPTADKKGALKVYLKQYTHVYSGYQVSMLSNRESLFKMSGEYLYKSALPAEGGTLVSPIYRSYTPNDGGGNNIASTYRKLSGVLELTDSNLATYFANGTLTIPNGVTTVIFNTTTVKTVYLVQGTVQTNGYRLTIGGTWQPGNNSDYQGIEGCFPYYAGSHYYGYTGSSLPNMDKYSHFADYIYFNGMWFSKMY